MWCWHVDYRFWLRARFASRTGRTPLRRRTSRPFLIAADVEFLEARRLLTVTYNGGALLPNVEAQAVYLGSDWQSSASLNAQTGQLDTFLATIVNSPYMDMLTNAGYNVGRGTASAGAVDNITLSQSSGVTDAAIQSDIQALITSGKLQAPDANRLYVVYVEPGVVVHLGTDASNTTFLGYHGAFAGASASGKSADIRYAVIAYPGAPNYSSSSQGFASNFDELTSVSSHELAEAVTDPDVNYSALGWYDFQFNAEIGDLTGGYRTTLDGYVVQDLVNQQDQQISPVPPPVIHTTPLTLTGTADTTDAISFDDLVGAGHIATIRGDILGLRINSITSGTLTYTHAGVTAGVVSGSTVIYPGDVLNWTPDASATGSTRAFTISAYDATTGLSSPSTQVLVNLGSNPAATLASAPPVIHATNFTLTGTASGPNVISFSDLVSAGHIAATRGDILGLRIDSISSGTLTVTHSGATASVQAGSTIIYPGDVLNWTPAAGASGSTAAFKVSAFDATANLFSPSTQVFVNVGSSTVASSNAAPPVIHTAPLTLSEQANVTDVISFSDLVAAGHIAATTGDILGLRIDSIASGLLSVTHAGATAIVQAGGTIIYPGDVLNWTPPALTTGSTAALAISAYDATANLFSPSAQVFANLH